MQFAGAAVNHASTACHTVQAVACSKHFGGHLEVDWDWDSESDCVAAGKVITLHGHTTMSNARELALIEKWADIATPATPTRPTLSPTSPRSIVKFCCCPQRRRYDLRQAKCSGKNTLHARNIFVDNDFSYIDDVAAAGLNQRRSHTDCQNDKECSSSSSSSNSSSDSHDNANDIAGSRNDGNVALILMNQRNLSEQWRQDNKGNSSSNSSSDLSAATKTCAVTKSPQSGNEQQRQPIQRLSNSLQQQQQQQLQQQQHSNKENTLSYDNNNKPRCNYCKLPDTDDDVPQTNSTTTRIDATKSSQNKMTITTATTATARATACECGQTTTGAEAEEFVGAATEVLCNDKATLTAAAAAAAATTAPKPRIAARPTTPSRLKTVIKTTMVKRSPSHDSTQAAAHVLPQSQPNSCSNIAHDEPRRSVRERIAAFAAGNEPLGQSGATATRQHDKLKKLTQMQCNGNGNGNGNTNQNNMTSDVKSAISSGSSSSSSGSGSRNLQHQTLINGKATTPKAMAGGVARAAARTAAGAEGSATVEAAKSAAQGAAATDATRYKSGLSDATGNVADVDGNTMAAATTTFVPSAASVFSTGCATMPRTRQYGSSATAAAAAAGATTPCNTMTADKKFLSQAAPSPVAASGNTAHLQHKLQFGDKAESKLAALDNLDLAHSLDLMDVDGDDPYGALQEYLERVKREINEVFELRKVQRREQQLREQLEAATGTAAGGMPLDELSRSTESDSGFDSSSTTATTGGGRAATRPVTTKLRALSPPPLGGAAAPAPLEDVNIWACKFLRDLDSLMAGDKLPPHLARALVATGSPSAIQLQGQLIDTRHSMACHLNRLNFELL
ncbi:Hypothetical predicted protein [Drosophila guanche]|uniref:Uncharacterized protein n=1 Tax=Drosophila guanche TaxID=7266 RepID=A0A3B0JHT8_DROGU|nr:Hypothetical predicted protein [Drosophila guanche]